MFGKEMIRVGDSIFQWFDVSTAIKQRKWKKREDKGRNN